MKQIGLNLTAKLATALVGDIHKIAAGFVWSGTTTERHKAVCDILKRSVQPPLLVIDTAIMAQEIPRAPEKSQDRSFWGNPKVIIAIIESHSFKEKWSWA
jgi:hypothetical protein